MEKIVTPRPASFGARWKLSSGLAALVLLSGCGGSGGGAASTPAPTPPPAPSPTPSPTPTPAPTPTPTPNPTFTDTAETRRTNGVNFHEALVAWNLGATGAGETIAIIDTGIDIDSPEFSGRISAASANLADASGTADAEDDHGTNVALIAAGGKDDTGVVGIAFNASILALRGDTPGSCATGIDSDDPLDGCTFSDTAIADGVDRAVREGATVINLSLGGSVPNANLRRAVSEAAAAGIVIVVAAGNDGDSTEAGIDPDQPDPFGAGLLGAGGANVIIAGSVNDTSVLSDFSNRAGDLGASYLAARGERLCCAYEDGVLQTETDENGDTFIFLFSGTSFAAPQISGAVALLAQAFPNLTGAEIVEILLDSARDVGDVGTDAVYGRGILDIPAAFAPAGTTSIAGSSVALPLADNAGMTSGAMGDAVQSASVETVLLDKYGRAYGYDVGKTLRGSAPRERLNGALASRGRSHSTSSPTASLAYTITEGTRGGGADWEPQLRLSQDDAEAARVLAARAAFKIAPNMQVGFAFRQGSDGLVAQLQGQDRPAFLIASSASGDEGFLRGTDVSFALRRTIGAWGLTLSAESGESYSGNVLSRADLTGEEPAKAKVSSFGATIDRDWGALDASFGASLLSEDTTVLGARFHEALGAGGADTLFLDASIGWDVAPGLRLGGALRQGHSQARGGGTIADGSQFISRAWSVDLEKRGVLSRFDSIGLRISQPLRVESGGLNLDLPVSYDYATESAQFGISRLSLTPQGREMMGEIAWRGPWLGGQAAASIYYRKDPGHYASLPDDRGVALRWSSDF
ncbi:S8 family peptidase [Altererythrobacter sp. ZODW24]|uniref:S8 family peptidase n=1 Tax=Altererythrobacter sp. ZODW24 TaxID=2185142 RepID=UPI000DF79775|nr:S8 family peptidase [Altererythrobacter sp. ZODW24]